MPPIVIKDFQWRENPEWVFIILDIKGIRTGGTGVVSSPTYLKVHYAPFIFEAFLRNEVDDTQSECLIDENSGKVSLRLKKATVGLIWEHLENKELTKEEKSETRSEALQITHQRHEQEKTEKQKRQFERKQRTVHDQIKLDAEAKDQIAKVKAYESEKALIGFNELALTVSAKTNNNNTKEESEKGNQITFLGTDDDDDGRRENSNKNHSSSQTQIFELPNKPKEIGAVPPASSQVGIRPTTCISVSFTPRQFPTPSRESKHVEEQEWLKKMAEARRLTGFVDEDLRPEERNPQWLLDKGISLMKAESFLGAVSAFSLGIRLAPKMPELYVERAGAHLGAKNYHRAVEDCSQALELLTPKVKANEGDRLKCHIRRGNAFRELDMEEDALADYNQAIALNPKNVEELISARNEIQAGMVERAEQMKSEAEAKEAKVKDCRNFQEEAPDTRAKDTCSSTDEED